MFIDEFYEEGFYQKLGTDYRSNFLFGQFFYTHAYYPHENLELWRPIFDLNEPTKTYASSFKLVTAGKDAFNKSIPLAIPKLETNEEFIVVRAKRRPVMLIMPPLNIGSVETSGYKGRVQRRRCLVAQVFGLADVSTGRAEFSPSFVDRVRKMEFPQLMFLPKHPGLFEVDSLLRLDECQSVFVPHLEPLQYAIDSELEAIVRGQLQYLFVNNYSGDYAELRELMLNT